VDNLLEASGGMKHSQGIARRDRRLHGVESRHVESVPVKEEFKERQYGKGSGGVRVI